MVAKVVNGFTCFLMSGVIGRLGLANACIVLSTFIQTVKKEDPKVIAVQDIIISTTPSTLARFCKASLHVNIKRICELAYVRTPQLELRRLGEEVNFVADPHFFKNYAVQKCVICVHICKVTLTV